MTQLAALKRPCVFLVLALPPQKFSLMTYVPFLPSFDEGWGKCNCLHCPHLTLPFVSFGTSGEGIGNHVRPSRRVVFVWHCCSFGGLSCPPFYVFSLGPSVMRVKPSCAALGWTQTLSGSCDWLRSGSITQARSESVFG